MKLPSKFLSLSLLPFCLITKAEAAGGYFFTTVMSEDFTTSGVVIADGSFVSTSIPFTGPVFDDEFGISNISITVNLSASGDSINSDGTVTDINAAGSQDELSLQLVSPDGTIRSLINPGTYDFFATTGDELVTLNFADGGIAQSGSNLLPGTFIPAGGAFGIFDGEEPEGNWQLIITDSSPGDPKSLNSYTLRITQEVPEPSSMLLLGLGLPLLLTRRRK